MGLGSVLSLQTDTGGRGGVSTVNHWYDRWMADDDRTRTKIVLRDRSPIGDFARHALGWDPSDPSIPLLLPHLHVPQYLAGRVLLGRAPGMSDEAHVVGAHVVHGSLLAGRREPSLVWFCTTLEDERRMVNRFRPPHRRAAYTLSMPWLARLEDRVLRRATRVMAMSPYAVSLARAAGVGSDRIEIVPIPIDTGVFKPVERERTGILFVGRAGDPRKNFSAVERLLATSEVVAAEGLDVVSDEDPRPRMDSAVAARVRWWDYSDVAGLVERYQSARLLVLTSIQEGFGLVIFEALACETPVVAIRCGGPDAFLERSGGGHVVAGESELKGRVEELLKDPAARQELGATGRAWVDTHMSATSFLADRSTFTL